LEHCFIVDRILDIGEDGLDTNLPISDSNKENYIAKLSNMVIEHNGWVAGILAELKYWRNNPCQHKNRHIITERMFKEIDYVFDEIILPVHLWSDRYRVHTMNNLSKMFRKMLNCKPLTINQSSQVINLLFHLLINNGKSFGYKSAFIYQAFSNLATDKKYNDDIFSSEPLTDEQVSEVLKVFSGWLE